MAKIVPAVTVEAKDVLVEYLSRKLETTPQQLVGTMPFSVHAIVHGDRLMGAVLYTNYRRTSIEMAWAGERGWITRGALREIFSYPFLKLGVLRATGCVECSNEASRQFAVDIGCREVGFLECEYGPGRDGIVYSMTPARCRWINPKNRRERIKTNGKRRT